MKLFVFILSLWLILFLGGCNLTVQDSPELRAKMGEVVVPVPDLPVEEQCLDIKLNISSQGEKIAHLPSSPNYNQVEIDKKGESFVCTVEQAEAEGFRMARN